LAVSQTVRVAAKDDHVNEFLESQNVTISIASNAYKFADLAVESLLVSIEDDEDSAKSNILQCRFMVDAKWGA
jgi:hypothetical protein